jgi:tetratricopeptide (TPR) repeat protein
MVSEVAVNLIGDLVDAPRSWSMSRWVLGSTRRLCYCGHSALRLERRRRAVLKSHVESLGNYPIRCHLCLPLFLLCVFVAPALRGQTVACIVGHGPGANGWVFKDNTPVGRLLGEGVMTINGPPQPKLRAIYRTVLDDAEQLPDTDPCKARAFLYAALFYEQQGDPKKALTLQKRVIEIDRIALPPGHPRLILDLRQLAHCYDSAGMPEEGEATYQRVLDMMQNSTGMTSLDRVFTYSEIAAFYDRREQFSQAEALYRRASDFASQLQPSLAVWSLNVRSELAHVIEEEGNPNQADAVLAAPTPPITVPRPPGAPAVRHDLSGPLSDLARAKQYESEGEQQDAEDSYLKAASALQTMNDPGVRGILLSALNQLGDLYAAEQRYAEAESALLRSLSLWEELVTARGSRYVAAPASIGSLDILYRDEGQAGNIVPLYQRVLDLQEQKLGPDNVLVSITLSQLANAYEQQGDYESALPLLQRVLAIQEKKWGSDSPLLLGILDPYARVLDKLNRPNEAAALRVRMKRIRAQQSQ